MVVLPSKTLKSEYLHFTLRAWQPNESWTALSGERKLAENLARDYFWDKVKDRVSEELNQLRGEGWEPIEPIGPQSIKLRSYYTIDFSIDPSDLFLWFMTLFTALIIQLIMNRPRRYVTYTPVEIRIRLSKLKRHQRQTAA